MSETGRERFPAHEARHPWLTRLLDAYAISDAATRADLTRETAKRGAPPACGPGCGTCCRDQHIPVTEFEVLGIWWYTAEIMPEPLQQALSRRLLGHGETGECAFLLDGSCSVYPMRPFICRHYHVFGRPCAPGENLFETRPGDVFRSALDSGRELAWQIIPLYGVAEENVDWLHESGYMPRKGRYLHTLPLDNIIMHIKTAAHLRKARNA